MITAICNDCHEQLTNQEFYRYSLMWQYSGDMYCFKCSIKNKLGGIHKVSKIIKYPK